MEGGCSCADNDEYLCSRVFSLMMVVTLAAIVVRGNVKLPTGRELFSILPVAVGGVSGVTFPLLSSLLPLSLLHRCCCCRVVVVVIFVVGRRHYCSCFCFSFSLLLSLLLSFSFSVFVIVLLSKPFRSVVLRIRCVTTVVI